MGFLFQWDSHKAESNIDKYSVSFTEAATAFEDPLSLTISDPLHSTTEERFVLIGRSENGRILVVVHSEDGDTTRIISAREATRREKKTYEEDNAEF